MNSMSQQYWPGPQPYPSDNSPLPPYAYRDLSLYYSANGADYTYGGKQRQFRKQRFFIQICFFLFAIGGALILPFHNSAVYNTYQQGTCTITDKQVDKHVSKDKHGYVTDITYYPQLSYTVHPAGSGQASASGFDGPQQTGYSSSSEAREVVDRYQIGETTTCWYNPAEPDKAFLVFYGYNMSDAISTYILCLTCFSAFALTIYLLLDWTVWRLYALGKRGVVTQGTVVRHEERRSKGGSRYTVSIVSFCAFEEPNRAREIKVDQVIQPGSQVPVCYDPLYPRYRRYGQWPDGANYLTGLFVIVLLLVIASFVMLGLWLAP
jgi:hypothetical protein